MLTDMTIGDLSRRTGCAIETIRYYEKIGLVPAPPRFGRFRRFSSTHVDRVLFIRRARDLGFTLDAVRTLLTLTQPGPECCAKVREIAENHLAVIRARLAELLRVQETLVDAVKGCDSPVNGFCPVIDAISRTGCSIRTCDDAIAAAPRAGGADIPITTTR